MLKVSVIGFSPKSMTPADPSAGLSITSPPPSSESPSVEGQPWTV